MALHHIAQKVTENYRRLVVMWECGWSVGYFTGALLHRRDTTQARYYTGAILHRRDTTQAGCYTGAMAFLAASPAASPPALGATLRATPAQIFWPSGEVSNAQ
jgi:hypothetical protein